MCVWRGFIYLAVPLIHFVISVNDIYPVMRQRLTCIDINNVATSLNGQEKKRGDFISWSLLCPNLLPGENNARN